MGERTVAGVWLVGRNKILEGLEDYEVGVEVGGSLEDAQ
jgi:hypothetical protein